MGHGRGHGARAREAEAVDEAVHDRTGSPVPFHQRQRQHVLVQVGLHHAAGHLQRGGQVAGRRLVFQHADDVGRHRALRLSGSHAEVNRGQAAGNVHRLPEARLMRPGGQVEQQAAFFRGHCAVDDHHAGGKVVQALRQHQVGTAPRRQAPQVALHAEMLRGIDGHHLQRHERVAAQLDRVTQHPVHVALPHQRGGVRVVGAEDELARVQAPLRHGGDLCGHVVPGRTEPQHRAQAAPGALHGVDLARVFVIVSRAAGQITMKVAAQTGAGVVAAHGLAGAHRSRHFGVHQRVVVGQAGGSSSSRRGR